MREAGRSLDRARRREGERESERASGSGTESGEARYVTIRIARISAHTGSCEPQVARERERDVWGERGTGGLAEDAPRRQRMNFPADPTFHDLWINATEITSEGEEIRSG